MRLEHGVNQGRFQGTTSEALWRNLNLPPYSENCSASKMLASIEGQPFAMKRTILIGCTDSHFRGAFYLLSEVCDTCEETLKQTLNVNLDRNRHGIASESTWQHTLNTTQLLPQDWLQDRADKEAEKKSASKR